MLYDIGVVHVRMILRWTLCIKLKGNNSTATMELRSLAYISMTILNSEKTNKVSFNNFVYANKLTSLLA